LNKEKKLEKKLHNAILNQKPVRLVFACFKKLYMESFMKKIFIGLMITVSLGTILFQCKKEEHKEEVAPVEEVIPVLTAVVKNADGIDYRLESKVEAEISGKLAAGESIVIKKTIGDIVLLDEKTYNWIEIEKEGKPIYALILDEDILIEKTPFEVDSQSFCTEIDKDTFLKEFESGCFGPFSLCASSLENYSGFVLKADGSFQFVDEVSQLRFASKTTGTWKKSKKGIQITGELEEISGPETVKYKVTGSIELNKAGKLTLSNYIEKRIAYLAPDCKENPGMCAGEKTFPKIRKKSPISLDSCVYPLDLNKKFWSEAKRWSESQGKMTYASALKKCESMKMSLPSFAQWQKAGEMHFPGTSMDNDGFWAKSYPNEKKEYSLVKFFATDIPFHVIQIPEDPKTEHNVYCIQD
jgi:hypothetical protein